VRILVLGYVVRCPIGGMAWHYAQYAKGLLDLGHDVYFIEDSEDHEWSCYNPVTHEQGIDPEHGLEFAGSVFGRLGLGSRWAYYDAHKGLWRGPCAADAPGICTDAELLLNISGSNPVRPWMEAVPHRVFIDTDPAFEQVRQITVARRAERAAHHNSFFTFGENFGRPACSIPDDGLPWQPTRQPVVLRLWPVAPPPDEARLTTVMQWDSYESREYDGVEYGMKSRSFGEFAHLPGIVDVELELALGSKDAPKDELRARGWHLSNPLEATRDPWTYQEFIQHSLGEFSVAKHGYVVTRSGWFSERTANYLASGRPVIVQDTGFGDWMETGAGVWPVQTADDARAAIDDMLRNYAGHSEAARAIAERSFDSDRVLNDLLDRATSRTAT
jgi:hypothetical protein